MKTHSKPFRCDACSGGFALRLDLERHIRARHRVGNNQHRCPIDRCQSSFKRKDNLKKHVWQYHPSAPPSAKSSDSIADATTTASLPQAVGIPSAAGSSNGVYSISMFIQAATSGNIATLGLLMTFGLMLGTTAGDGSTALHCAARNGQAKTVQYLLDKGADVNAKNKSGRIPLHEGFLSSDLDTVKVLIEHMPNEQNVRERYHTERFLARTNDIKIHELYVRRSKAWSGTCNANRIFGHAMVAKNNALTTRLLQLPSFDVNRRDSSRVPIHDAVQYGNAKMMELLLAFNGIDKGRTTKISGLNALHLAARYGHADIVEQLLNLEFDVDSSDNDGRTPLQHATMRGHLAIIKLLVDRWKANISHSDPYGHTPLHYAAFNGHWECVHVLLEHIASKSHGDAVDIQIANMEFVKKDVVIRLLNSAAFGNPTLRGCRFANTLLGCAVEKGDLEVIEALLTYDRIDVNAQNNWYQSPLFKAVERRQIEAVKLLL